MPRLFVAILIPKEIIGKITDYQKKIKNLNIRLIKPENFHLTLVFLGQIREKKIEIIKRILKEIGEKYSSFFLEFRKIISGPDLKRPRLIWLEAENNEEIKEIWKAILEKFKREEIFFDEKSLRPHLTLARTRGKELFGKKIEKEISLILPVKEIALMESKLKPTGAEYKIIEKFKLK